MNGKPTNMYVNIVSTGCLRRPVGILSVSPEVEKHQPGNPHTALAALDH